MINQPLCSSSHPARAATPKETINKKFHLKYFFLINLCSSHIVKHRPKMQLSFQQYIGKGVKWYKKNKLVLKPHLIMGMRIQRIRNEAWPLLSSSVYLWVQKLRKKKSLWRKTFDNALTKSGRRRAYWDQQTSLRRPSYGSPQGSPWSQFWWQIGFLAIGSTSNNTFGCDKSSSQNVIKWIRIR